MRGVMAVMLALGALALGLPAAAQAAPTETARTVVETTIADVLDVLRRTSEGVEERRSEIEQIAYARFDFDTMGKLVLARNWKKFDDGQRDAFIGEFKRHLSRSYGTRIARYEQEEVEIAGEREEKRGDVTVLTIIRGGQFEGATVNYRMRNREDAWRVIDVVIEGVSLVSNFRSQFKDIVSKEGPDGLIAQLKQRNDEAGPAASE
jgi:phospholipid transport system substrate-binding protein